ncbi:hypothetical protein PPACK8108_LOCUS18650 [Phakopsora pachyrhizi]|uniref:Uncharacterized protein n=1 Tax=Phakopsora pachyrhizi TaxID=170000 RepID=A0AAV0BER7_PHAPC|nr:hypothetical protein PPACK8108_LOCUS18650 [Phakopsora pachyrhizi]
MRETSMDWLNQTERRLLENCVEKKSFGQEERERERLDDGNDNSLGKKGNGNKRLKFKSLSFRPRMRMRKRITINNPKLVVFSSVVRHLKLKWGTYKRGEGGVDDWVVGCILRLEAKEWGIVSMKTTERLKREGKGNKASFQRGKTRMTAPGAHDGDRC